MVNFSAIKPLFSRVLIKKIVPEAKSVGGILLKTDKAETNTGVVLAVGPGQVNDVGKLIPTSLKIGDTVLLPEFGGVRVPTEEHQAIYHESDILGVIERI